jgi:class 3 adenylate cyclase
MDKRFEEQLLKYAQETDPQERHRIEAGLWKDFGAVKAVLIMDLSGFSLLTQKYGIVHYLSIVRRMQVTARPIIEREGGSVVKFEADNCFAMFDDPLHAVNAAIALNAAFDEINVYTEDRFDIRISSGIDYGDVLLIGGPDYFGATVNCASKIGEDLASPGEILITKTAYEKIPAGAGIRGEPLRLTIAGIEVDALTIRY